MIRVWSMPKTTLTMGEPVHRQDCEETADHKDDTEDKTYIDSYCPTFLYPLLPLSNLSPFLFCSR